MCGVYSVCMGQNHMGTTHSSRMTVPEKVHHHAARASKPVLDFRAHGGQPVTFAFLFPGLNRISYDPLLQAPMRANSTCRAGTLQLRSFRQPGCALHFG